MDFSNFYEISPAKRYAARLEKWYGLKLPDLYKDWNLPQDHTPQTLEAEVIERFQTNSSTWVERSVLRTLTGGNRYCMHATRHEIKKGDGLEAARTEMLQLANDIITLNPELADIAPVQLSARKLFNFIWGVCSSFNRSDIMNFLQPNINAEDKRLVWQAKLDHATGLQPDWVMSASTINKVLIAFYKSECNTHPVLSMGQKFSQIAETIHI